MWRKLDDASYASAMKKRERRSKNLCRVGFRVLILVFYRGLRFVLNEFAIVRSSDAMTGCTAAGDSRESACREVDLIRRWQNNADGRGFRGSPIPAVGALMQRHIVIQSGKASQRDVDGLKGHRFSREPA